MTGNGRSASSSHGCRATIVRDRDAAALRLAAGRIDDPVPLVRSPERLRPEVDDAHVPRGAVALGLQRPDQGLVVEVTLAEVPAEDEPRDDLALDAQVGLRVLHGRSGPAAVWTRSTSRVPVTGVTCR